MRKSNLNGKILSYDEIIDIIIPHLAAIHNLKEFCVKNNLNFNTIYMIKNKNTKQHFPIIVSKLLNIFGYNNQIIKGFKLLQ